MADRTKREKHRAPKRLSFGLALQPQFQRYTSLVGEVTWASNNLHSELLVTFQVIFPAKPKTRVLSEYSEMAEELWHSLRSDDAQRGALRAVVMHSPLLTAKWRKSLLWAIESAGKLSGFRNDAIHTAFEFSWEEGWDKPRAAKLIPSGWGSPKRVEKLQRVGHTKLFRALIGDLNQLKDYVEAIWLSTLDWGDERPPTLPKRPILQSVLLVQKSPPKSNSPTSPTQSRSRRVRQSQV